MSRLTFMPAFFLWEKPTYRWEEIQSINGKFARKMLDIIDKETMRYSDMFSFSAPKEEQEYIQAQKRKLNALYSYYWDRAYKSVPCWGIF